MTYQYLTGLTTGMVLTVTVMRPSLAHMACSAVCLIASHVITSRTFARARGRR